MTATKNAGSRGWMRWVGIGVFVVLLVGVGGPFVYFHFIEGTPPAKLTLAKTPVPSDAKRGARVPLAGTWKIGSGSVVRYRVKEKVLGQSDTAVGSTSKITGSMTIADTLVTSAAFTVDMTTFSSNQGIRDDQFQHRIMDTADFPTSTFTLTSPIELSPVPADSTTVGKTYSATGKLALHGTTQTVTMALSARRTGDVITVVGSTPITFSDYKIDNPSGGPASVGNTGTLEFALQLRRAA